MDVQLDDFTRLLARDQNSSFYRDAWGTYTKFADLPSISREDFVRVPLSQRRYKDEKGMVKIVPTGRGPFFSEWSFKDVASEYYGPVTSRPFVRFENSHEAIEKSIWCYEQNSVPLIAEQNLDVAIYAANRYRVNSLIIDTTSLDKLLPLFETLSEPLISISVHGTSFDIENLRTYGRFANDIYLVLSLPETGAFASTTIREYPTFVPFPDCILESNGLLTKTKLLTTPIVRYQIELDREIVVEKNDL